MNKITAYSQKITDKKISAYYMNYLSYKVKATLVYLFILLKSVLYALSTHLNVMTDNIINVRIMIIFFVDFIN